MQDRMNNRIKYFSNRSRSRFNTLNCQSGKYQRVLIARAFVYCVKIGLMQCQRCLVSSSMFKEIGWELPKIHFDHWTHSIKWSKRMNASPAWMKVSHHVCNGSLRPMLHELPRTRLLHAACHARWDEHADD